MRLTQPFRGWQLAILLIGGFPALAVAQTMDTVTRTQALELDDFPRDVVLVGALPNTLDDGAFDDAVRAALATWNNVTCSSAELRYAGRVDAADDAPVDATTIAFVDGAAEPCFGVDNDVGWTLFTPCGDWRETAVLLNENGYTWQDTPDPYATDATVDVQSVLTHELGHSLGLLHEDVTDPLASMSTSYLRDGGLATLAADDKLALCALYPTDSDECTSDADCAGACVESDGRAVCDELRVDAGGYCDLADLNCAGGQCRVTSPATYSGYCAPECVVDADCSAEMSCADGVCQLIPVPLSDEGCSTAGKRGGWLGLLLVGWFAIRRRCS